MKTTLPSPFVQFQKDIFLAIRDALSEDKISNQQVIGFIDLFNQAKTEQEFKIIAQGLSQKHKFIARVFEKEELIHERVKDADKEEEIKSKLIQS